MKKLIASLALVLSASVSPVFAADAVVESVPAPEVVDAFSWTGFYVGLNAGYGGGTFEHPFSIYEEEGDERFNIATGTLDISAGGFVGGAQAGYNFQSGAFVYGLEADIQASTVEGEIEVNAVSEFDEELSASAGTELDWFGTLRARLGYTPTERLLVYGTGGFAYGKTTSHIQASMDDFTMIDESVSKTRTGWTIGGGLEYAVTNHLTVKSEYLYTDLGSENLYSGPLGEGPSLDLDSDVKFHTVRVGVNYKF